MIYLIYTVLGVWLMVMFHVLTAFRRSAVVFSGTGVHHLMAGLFWIVAISTFRGIFWDVIPLVMGRDEFRNMISIYGYVTWPNLVFHSIMAVSGLRLMYGFWLLLPDEDRNNYNLFTAVFYPKKLRILFKERN